MRRGYQLSLLDMGQGSGQESDVAAFGLAYLNGVDAPILDALRERGWIREAAAEGSER